MGTKLVKIEDLMGESRVKFGTSGARGLVSDMTDKVCYAYTAGFIQYLEHIGELAVPGTLAIGGDLRNSTGRIMEAVARAIHDRGYQVESAGRLPSPALCHLGLVKEIPTVMVTGSHIPDDRNGIKYTKKGGEILKADEAGMKAQVVALDEDTFDDTGALTGAPIELSVNHDGIELYVRRFLDFFPEDCLRGKRVGVYLHSAVGRELMLTILSDLGAEVTALGFSEAFIPVDTEAIREEDVEAARAWAAAHDLDAIVTTDGDSDRPLIADETGAWLRGDVAGILCAAYLGADAVATPVSCNSALEKCGLFSKVYRTRIGSPYVIEGMERARSEGAATVVGYEANGGFLQDSPFERDGRILRPLPTRDALIVQLAILLLSQEKQQPISELRDDLPRRYTFSDRLKSFPTERSRDRIAELYSGDASRDRAAIEAVFGADFGTLKHTDTTDGLRMTFESDEVLHLRPSGNAPEFRCYVEADTEERAVEINRRCMAIMETWR
ncbi:phosphomannomutase [Planctomycetota bacterium]